MKRALKRTWQTIETHCEQIHGKKPLLKGGWGEPMPGQLQNRDHAPLYLRYFDDTSCAVCDILDVYDISCATLSADI